jgi:sterol desaturase/sphingolipid hydroxylase (fatty acid hydroxylase superfamily)
MKRFVQSLWDFDLANRLPVSFPFLLLTVFLMGVSVVYPVKEVLLGGHFHLREFNLLEKWDDFLSISFQDGFRAALPMLWVFIALFTVIFRISVIVHSFFLSKRQIGERQFTLHVATYMPALAIGLLSSVLLLLSANSLFSLFGWSFELSLSALEGWMLSFQQWINVRIPSLLNIQNYWLALILTIFTFTLPGYFGHWLCHTSRFFWYVSHRAHHVPQFLYPLAAPDAFNFTLPLFFIRGLIAIGISKLIYTEPLVMEITIWFTMSHIVEAFNHSIVHYDFALRNPIIRNMSRLFGEFGVYHLMHHSAKPEDHTINLSGTPFLFWDRVFGTYRKPYDTAPPLGLTNQPEIIMNPFRITFSGFAQLWYEWKHNKDRRTRFKIIFGSIWYKPPITKDFLVPEH